MQTTPMHTTGASGVSLGASLHSHAGLMHTVSVGVRLEQLHTLVAPSVGLCLPNRPWRATPSQWTLIGGAGAVRSCVLLLSSWSKQRLAAIPAGLTVGQ